MASVKYFGKYRAKVSDINDPQYRGRIRVNCPKVFGDGSSSWCEPCIPVAYDNGGDLAIPKVGEFVWVEFEEGDCNKPIYTGGLWSAGKSPSPGYEIKNRLISWGNCSILMSEDGIHITSPKIFINGESVINKSLIISGSATVGGDLSTSGSLSVNKSASVSGSISSSSSIRSTGSISSDTSIATPLVNADNVNASVNITAQTLAVEGNTEVSNITSSGNVTAQGTLTVSGTSTLSETTINGKKPASIGDKAVANNVKGTVSGDSVTIAKIESTIRE